MPHIHTEPGQHDHTISAFIIKMIDDKPKILLHMHRKLGTLLPFGGHIELDETPWQAVSHEILEESGYDLSQLEIFQPPSRIKTLTGIALHPYPVCSNTHNISQSHYHSDLSYAFVTKEGPDNSVEAGESEIFMELTREDVLNQDKNDIAPNIREICLFIFDEVLQNWEMVNPKDFAL